MHSLLPHALAAFLVTALTTAAITIHSIFRPPANP
jgi:hypothetical protein